MSFDIAGTQGEEGTHYFRIDGYEDAFMFAYRILRKTPKGVWIKTEWNKPDKFILNSARKRWAYPTRELARNSYRIRKERQICHCNDMINAANAGLVAVGFKAIDRNSCFKSYREGDFW